MTTQDLINTLRQGKPMTDKLMREIVRELEEKTEQLHTMATALRAKDADYAALREAVKKMLDAYKRAEECSCPYCLEDFEKSRAEVSALVGEEGK